MSATMLHARPHSSEPTRNRPMPTIIIGLRPYWSASLEYSGTETAWPSR